MHSVMQSTRLILWDEQECQLEYGSETAAKSKNVDVSSNAIHQESAERHKGNKCQKTFGTVLNKLSMSYAGKR